MLRVIGGGMVTLLPLPALAAGGLDDAPILFWVALYSAIAVPAVGVGFVLGCFLRLSISIFVLVVLAMAPIGWVWATRGFERAADLAPVLLVTLLLLSPMFYAGWHYGRRHISRYPTRGNSFETGN